jgi:hypothetical protein
MKNIPARSSDLAGKTIWQVKPSDNPHHPKARVQLSPGSVLPTGDSEAAYTGYFSNLWIKLEVHPLAE